MKDLSYKNVNLKYSEEFDFDMWTGNTPWGTLDVVKESDGSYYWWLVGSEVLFTASGDEDDFQPTAEDCIKNAVDFISIRCIIM